MTLLVHSLMSRVWVHSRFLVHRCIVRYFGYPGLHVEFLFGVKVIAIYSHQVLGKCRRTGAYYGTYNALDRVWIARAKNLVMIAEKFLAVPVL